jgi:hypothetical protein
MLASDAAAPRAGGAQRLGRLLASLGFRPTLYHGCTAGHRLGHWRPRARPTRSLDPLAAGDRQRSLVILPYNQTRPVPRLSPAPHPRPVSSNQPRLASRPRDSRPTPHPVSAHPRPPSPQPLRRRRRLRPAPAIPSGLCVGALAAPCARGPGPHAPGAPAPPGAARPGPSGPAAPARAAFPSGSLSRGPVGPKPPRRLRATSCPQTARMAQARAGRAGPGRDGCVAPGRRSKFCRLRLRAARRWIPVEIGVVEDPAQQMKPRPEPFGAPTRFGKAAHWQRMVSHPPPVSPPPGAGNDARAGRRDMMQLRVATTKTKQLRVPTRFGTALRW